MRQFIIIGLVGCALLLGGCSKTASDLATDIATTTATLEKKAKEVQGYAVKLCSFLPTTASIISIFNSGFGDSVSKVGTAICDAVTTIPLADGPGDRKPRVHGVVVQGRFVR